MKKFFTVMATTTVVCLGVAGVNVSAEEHEVVKNDTLWDLSQKYNTSVQTIMDHNSMDSTNIFPGEKISIDGEATDKKESDSETDIHKVESGDTLSGISAKYGVTINNLKSWNNLSSTLIIVGQELKVKQDVSESSNNEEKQEVTEEPVVEEPVAEEPAEEEVAQESEPKAEENTAEKVETEEPAEKEEPKAEPVEQSNEQEQSNETSSNGETKTVTATAYTAECDGCSGVTSTGIDLNANPNQKVIAVDPSVIPLGTEVYVEGYGKAVAGDTGGAIKGNKIDLHVPSKGEANSWGVRTVNVEILD